MNENQSSDVWAALMERLAALRSAEKIDEAIALAKLALEEAEREHGHEHAILVPVLAELAWLYGQKENYGASEILRKRSLAILEKAHGSDSPKITESLLDLAMLYVRQNRFRRAKPLLERVAAIADGPDHRPGFGNLFRNLPSFCRFIPSALVKRCYWQSVFSEGKVRRLEQAELPAEMAVDRTPSPRWKLRGFDVISGKSYYPNALPGYQFFGTENGAIEAAREYLEDLQGELSSASNDGQDCVLDEMYVIRPDGTEFRVGFPAVPELNDGPKAPMTIQDMLREVGEINGWSYDHALEVSRHPSLRAKYAQKAIVKNKRLLELVERIDAAGTEIAGDTVSESLLDLSYIEKDMDICSLRLGHVLRR